MLMAADADVRSICGAGRRACWVHPGIGRGAESACIADALEVHAAVRLKARRLPGRGVVGFSFRVRPRTPSRRRVLFVVRRRRTAASRGCRARGRLKVSRVATRHLLGSAARTSGEACIGRRISADLGAPIRVVLSPVSSNAAEGRAPSRPRDACHW